jgi:hypothetical protein
MLRLAIAQAPGDSGTSFTAIESEETRRKKAKGPLNKPPTAVREGLKAANRARAAVTVRQSIEECSREAAEVVGLVFRRVLELDETCESAWAGLLELSLSPNASTLGCLLDYTADEHQAFENFEAWQRRDERHPEIFNRWVKVLEARAVEKLDTLSTGAKTKNWRSCTDAAIVNAHVVYSRMLKRGENSADELFLI